MVRKENGNYIESENILKQASKGLQLGSYGPSKLGNNNDNFI